jgi:SAM-dependent methyltransferase
MAQTPLPRNLPLSVLAGTLFFFLLVGAADTASVEDAEAQPFIGIEMGGSSDGGTRVDRVIPGTAAEEFGLAAGDVILRIDDTRAGSPRRVRNAIASLRPGDEIEIELLRSGERRTIRLELGLRPDELELRRDRADHVLEVLQLRPGLDVADIGCGSGWLSEAIATELDGSGKVYAVELDEGHVDSLQRRALPGIVPVLSEPGDVSLPEDSLDVAMLHDVASHIDPDARESFYLSVRRALRHGGRLVVFGPHGEAVTVLEVLRANGFVPLDDGLATLDADELDRRLLEGIVFRSVSEEAPPER